MSPDNPIAAMCLLNLRDKSSEPKRCTFPIREINAPSIAALESQILSLAAAHRRGSTADLPIFRQRDEVKRPRDHISPLPDRIWLGLNCVWVRFCVSAIRPSKKVSPEFRLDLSDDPKDSLEPMERLELLERFGPVIFEPLHL
jgi:hypothetical protein